MRGRKDLPDYVKRDAVAEFIRYTDEQYAARLRPDFSKTIPGSFFEEIFNLRPAWDPLLEELCRAQKGYESREVLPLLFMEEGREPIKGEHSRLESPAFGADGAKRRRSRFPDLVRVAAGPQVPN